MKNVLCIAAIPLFATLLSACGGGGGGGPVTAGNALTAPGIAVGEPSPPARVVAADFIRLARESGCSEQRNRLFVIDGKQVLWDRAGNCADASYAQTLYGVLPAIQLCSSGDTIAGPRTSCTNDNNRALFDTMLKNLDKADLGLGAGHTVEQLAVPPRDGSNLTFEILWQSPFGAVDDARDVVVTDTAAFEKLWNEAHLNLSSIHLPPKIDFTRKMVVGVFTGKQLEGCRSVMIGRTGIEDGKLVVEYDTARRQTVPVCKPEFTSPGMLAVLDRVDAPAQFRRIEPQPLAYTLIDPELDSSDTSRAPATAVVKDAAGWAALWARYGKPGATPPAVDFSKSMALFAFYGVTSGCDGNELTDVSMVNGRIYATNTYTPPGPATMCVAAFMAHAKIAVVARSEQPVVFISKRLPPPSI